MTEVGNVYGQSLYQLAKDEGLSESIVQELDALKESFSQEPDFQRLLSTPSLTKAERCQILDDSFRGKVHPYVLNFLKILTEKGYMRYFGDCCLSYTQQFDQDHGILRVTAMTAVALSEAQVEKLTDKLSQMTGKKVVLLSRIDPGVLGGVRLDYDGQRLDDTLAHRLDAIRSMLSKTVI